MAKRRTELSTDVVMNFRINRRMKEQIDTAADKEGISSAEWIRRVLQEHIEREETGGVEHSLPDSSEVLTRNNLLEALKELKKEGFSFENL